jgi:hypothetical protein
MVKSLWKTMKFIRTKAHLDISIMYPLGKEILTNKHFKRTFENKGSILTFQKFITTIWLKFHQKNISHLIL